jgi:hypothetical protein
MVDGSGNRADDPLSFLHVGMVSSRGSFLTFGEREPAEGIFRGVMNGMPTATISEHNVTERHRNMGGKHYSHSLSISWSSFFPARLKWDLKEDPF